MAGFEDWLTVNDPSLIAEHLAERFRLSQQELQKASEALAPAFALGLSHAMQTPARFAELSRGFLAMAPAGDRTRPGETFLDAFFGSEPLKAAVARQASLFAGIAPDTIQKLMPSLAALSMETMVRATMDNMQRHNPALAGGDLGGATAEMMRRGANAVEALTRPSDAPAARRAQTPPNYFAEAFTQGLRSFGLVPTEKPPAPEPTRAPMEAFNPLMPFAAMFDAFAKGLQGAPETQAPPPPSPPAAPPPRTRRPASPGTETPAPSKDDLVGELMRSSRKVQEDYAKEMAALFERYQGAAGKSDGGSGG